VGVTKVITHHIDGSLRDARNPADCLVHGAAPTPAPLPQWIETFRKLGMMDYEVYE